MRLNCIKKMQINSILLLTSALLLSLQYSLGFDGKDEIGPMLSNCQNLQNKLVMAQSLYKDINANRTQQINIYRMLTQQLKNNNTELQWQVNKHQSTIINKTELLLQLNNQLQNQTQVLYDFNKTLSETSKNLTSKEIIVQKLNLELHKIKLELSETKEIAVKQNLTIAAMNTMITQQNESIIQYNAQHDADSKQLKMNQALITELKRNVTAMSKQILELKSEQRSNAESISHLNSLIAAYTSCCQASSCTQFGNSSNVHVIKVEGFKEPFQVLCNSQLPAGAGWTVIQRRINGSIDFYRNWSEYKTGFGDLNGEFFIGLEKLYAITTAEPHELYIYLEDFDNVTHYARYDNFQLGSEQQGYPLQKLGTYAGDVDNALRLNEGQKFSTFDRDNDRDATDNCAEILHGGWWYYKCGLTNLNGLYQIADSNYDTQREGIFWLDENWHEMDYSLKSVQMMIRPKKS